MRHTTFVILFSVCALLTVSSCKPGAHSEDAKLVLTNYVDPYIGTSDHGHVFLGANVPFGLVQLGPTNITEGWDWCSGYHYSDSTIFGFSHMHLSGTGIGDLCDILVMPVTGEVKMAKGTADDPESGIYSLFDRRNESVRPGYYSVHLDRYHVDVELTATKRVGFHKYTFPKIDSAAVVFNLADKLNWDEAVECYIQQENDSTLSGYRYSTGWAKDQRIFFSAVFSKPINAFQVFDELTPQEGNALKAKKVYGKVMFDGLDATPLYIKVALSPVSIDNAKENMQTELPGWNFEQTIAAADDAWNAELNKIRIETSDESVKRTFYTALYHTMVAPSEFCDVNGEYYGADGQMHKSDGFVNYTTLSLWDTYRAAHPLMTIIHPEKMNDMINTMLNIYRQQGKLPVWHLVGNETDCMVGNPAIPVVADAILKGYDGFDKQLAYEAMKTSAMLDERGLKYLKAYGYIPYDKESPESLAKCMEYAIADWSLAQVAKLMGKSDDYDYFMERTLGLRHYYNINYNE